MPKLATDGSTPSGTPELLYTGERFHPDKLGEIRQEHMHRYAWISHLVRDKDVLDAASGEGFGSNILAATARSVIGVDLALQAVDHAQKQYALTKNLEFKCGDTRCLPLPDNCVDVVVSFETVEHVDEQNRMISEFRRVLRPDGVLVISSPNREVYSDKQEHHNEFHVRELDRSQFSDLLSTQFGAVEMFAQRLCVSSSILPERSVPFAKADVFLDDGELKEVATALPSTMYYIALAAASEDLLPTANSSFMVSSHYDVYWNMREELADQKRSLGRMKAQQTHLGNLFQKLSQQAGDVATLLSSEVFDPPGYAKRANLSDHDPEMSARHYLSTGERDGIPPSDRFDPVFYRSRYSDLADLPTSLLVHYLRAGQFEGRLPVAPGEKGDD
ncbi:class I SAM-dependent methyltransferase (plasmid) [Shinella sumterensis]|nr:class I SAM-dependent methyltransferase [Shinella sumterensis]